jgi:hypothetical protein
MSFYPELRVRRKAINNLNNVPEKETYSIYGLFNKELATAIGNADFYSNNASAVVQRLTTSPSSILQTKDLESSMIDYTDAVKDPIGAVLLRQWASMSHHGLYNAIVSFKDPKTSEIMSLNAYDAFIYMYYVSLMSIGIDITVMPPYINLKARKRAKPSLYDMLAVCDSQYTDLPIILSDILSEQPKLTAITSTMDFYAVGYKIYSEAWRHWVIASNTNHHTIQGELCNAIRVLYEDEHMVFPLATRDMDKWLAERKLLAYSYTHAEAQKLIVNIFTGATGHATDPSKIIENIQKAMLGMLTQFSSYTIQLLQSINHSK